VVASLCMSHYCICPARDGLLYVEFPSTHAQSSPQPALPAQGPLSHRRRLYYGAALAFDARYLYLAGVRPLWYLQKGASRRVAVEQLIEDGIYRDEDEAYEFDGHHYGDECEWTGPSGMCFDPRWIERVWLWPGRATPEELASRREEVGWLAPVATVEFGKPEFPEGGRRSCA